ncbi:hypothetical protein mRhiFer1_009216 [Rhinolophus ferrumequinum]|uniref:Core shell protein Gag P30 domain-containing protein n=1 Tax=Rhinolophus ferrumequinum TaxID=59479 RepID=A0A7J7S7W4_RHIFE|nr:hypothetical protein mRhiFer1_009216 [Rhinolophus ferrumequinum]
MSKTTDVTRNGEETPGDFYERLCEAFHVYTPFDLEVPENQRMINAAFVAQAAPDICQKLQKLEGFAGMNITQLLEVANKVYRNCEVVAKGEADKRMREKVTLLAAALQQGGDGPGEREPPHRQTGPGPCAPLKEDQ